MRGEGGSYATTEHRIHHLLTRLRRIDRDAATLKIMRLARIVVLMVMGSILIFATQYRSLFGIGFDGRDALLISDDKAGVLYRVTAAK